MIEASSSLDGDCHLEGRPQCPLIRKTLVI